MTTPLAPDIPSNATFGAPYQNADTVVDPTTEVESDYINRLIAQVTMLSHTAPKAWVRCTVSGLVVSVADHDAVWGNTPAVAPTVARIGTGHFSVTWATAYDDLQATPESHSVSIRAVNVAVGGAGGATLLWDYVITGANSVEIYTKSTGGVATSPAGFTVWVW